MQSCSVVWRKGTAANLSGTFLKSSILLITAANAQILSDGKRLRQSHG